MKPQKYKRILLCYFIGFLSCTTHEKIVADPQIPMLREFAQKLVEWPSYSYPYNDLADQLAAKGKKSLLLFSYGSLMDKCSASHTLSSQTLSTRRPVLGFGIKRVFDRDIAINPESCWGIPCDSRARGMVNIHPTKYLEEFVNGVLMEIPLDEIAALLDREEGYDLIPIVIADWPALMRRELCCDIAYTLHAPSESSYTNPSVFPRPSYYELTRDSTAQFGPLFSLLWQNTTYMADGKTPITVWEQWIQEGDPRTCIISSPETASPPEKSSVKK